MVILWGIVISFIAFMLTWLLTKGVIAKEWIEPRADYIAGVEEVDSKNYSDLLIKDANLPPVLLAAAPILVPVILITLASFAGMTMAEGMAARDVLQTIGNRNIATSKIGRASCRERV